MADLSNLTEELFVKSFTKQVGLRMPKLAMLLAHRQVKTKGGTKITYPVVMDDAEDEAQTYLPNEEMTVGQSDFTNLAKFEWKYMQMPLRYGVDEEIQNHLATSEVKRFDLVKLIVERGQDGTKRKLRTLINGTGSTDSGRDFQSINDALDHSRTYGTITSNTTTVAYWNGASTGDSYTDRASSWTLNLSNVRLALAIVRRYVDDNAKQYIFLPEAMHSKLQGICEASKVYTPSDDSNSKLHKHGFRTFQVYGAEVVCDSWMTLNSQTAYMQILNPETFEFRLHPSRAFRVTPFVWQGQVEGGKDQMVGRVLVCGNICCKKPRANLWKSNIS
jgi:hypothetical protein